MAALVWASSRELGWDNPQALPPRPSAPGALNVLCLFQHVCLLQLYLLQMCSAECYPSAAKWCPPQVRKDPNRTYTPLDNLLDGLKAEAAAASAAVGRSTVRVLTVPAPKPVQREPRRSGVGLQ